MSYEQDMAIAIIRAELIARVLRARQEEHGGDPCPGEVERVMAQACVHDLGHVLAQVTGEPNPDRIKHDRARSPRPRRRARPGR